MEVSNNLDIVKLIYLRPKLGHILNANKLSLTSKNRSNQNLSIYLKLKAMEYSYSRNIFQTYKILKEYRLLLVSQRTIIPKMYRIILP
jgi:hypothetical protein